jgi:hypothetical protein
MIRDTCRQFISPIFPLYCLWLCSGPSEELAEVEDELLGKKDEGETEYVYAWGSRIAIQNGN